MKLRQIIETICEAARDGLTIIPITFPIDDYETVNGQLCSGVERIVKNELWGVDKEPAYAAVFDDQVIGGILANWYEDERDGAYVFGFDVAVSQQFQRTGVAKELIQTAIADYDKHKREYGAQAVRVEVINNNLAKYLLTLGFEKVEKNGDVWLERP